MSLAMDTNAKDPKEQYSTGPDNKTKTHKQRPQRATWKPSRLGYQGQEMQDFSLEPTRFLPPPFDSACIEQWQYILISMDTVHVQPSSTAMSTE